MKKYLVTVYEVHSVDIEVEAENEEDAKDVANQKIEDYPYVVDYCYTQGTDEWAVTELRGSR